MPYATTTLTQAVADVSGRLADPTNVRWSVAEITALLQEALRTWSALTGSYRQTVVWPTSASVPFYDLGSIVPTLCGSTLTVADLIAQMELALLEPVNVTGWSGSTQFTNADLVSAIQRRRDQFLLETAMVLTRTTPIINPTMGGRIGLAEAIATVRRVAFTNSSGTQPLTRDDVWGFSHFAPSFVQQAGRPPQVPFTYSVGETPPLVMQIVPPPSDRGTLDLLTVNRGAPLDPTVPTPLGIPDDWVWVVGFGALADVLSKDGLAADPDRAAYCQSRWTQGVTAAKTRAWVLAARINNVDQVVNALQEADAFSPLWQSASGRPVTLLTTTGALVALSPVPNAVFGASADVVVNAPVPVLPTDFLPVGPELLDGLYDYVEHRCLFKEGMPALTSSQSLLERFYALAGLEISLETAQSPNRVALAEQTRRSEGQTPRVGTPA
jgi:hypothetical protein